MTLWNEPLRQAALRADNAWSAELARLFGKHAGDVRYTLAGKGDEGSKLRELHDARMAAHAAWHATLEH